MDHNYWKRAYQDTWGASSKKENVLAQWITKCTGMEVEETGLGAGTDVFISGSAAAHGYDKGDADLHVKGTDVYIEVTGPLSPRVPVSDPLWFRPDKFENAIANMANGHETFFAHYCPSGKLWRIVYIDRELAERYRRGAFKIVNPMIRGRRETYVAVPADDRCIQQPEFLIRYLVETER